jgi:hypothetical protein
MGDLLLSLDLGDLASVQGTAVSLLTSATGIEGGAVQDDPIPIHLGDGGGELCKIRVGLVKLDGHDLWMA